IVEREIGFDLNSLNTLKLALRNSDITTEQAITNALNAKLPQELGAPLATTLDPGTVEVTVPNAFEGNVSASLATVEQVMIEPDQPARIIIDEASGTIVMNENVRIDTVAIAQGNLVITIEEQKQVSQPGAFAPEGAQTTQVAATEIS